MNPTLKPGAVFVDLTDGSIHGDLDHCPKEDLLESAKALLSLLPQVKHKGLWGLAKDYDAGCHLYSYMKKRFTPPEVSLEVGWEPHRKFSLAACSGISREEFWKFTPYFKQVGRIVAGEVTGNLEGVVDHYRPPPPRDTVPSPKRVKTPQVEQSRLF